MNGIRIPGSGRVKPVVTLRAYRAMAKAIGQVGHLVEQERAIIALMFHAGLTPRALCALRLSERDGRLRVDDKPVLLPKPALAQLRRYMALERPASAISGLDHVFVHTEWRSHVEKTGEPGPVYVVQPGGLITWAEPTRTVWEPVAYRPLTPQDVHERLRWASRGQYGARAFRRAYLMRQAMAGDTEP
ncbi:hypothetical protein F8S09_17295 [Deinococcus sp. SDU3-2]|uniref:Uncharacterized protein n=1 Tax=Deinococcus terrestris TaxID=2651870 RepID=A0A7X1NZ10_9DEIO|nr:hypothetical protein [Deinococcus terrestris]MPY68408.1 hypothetical protein [Deinococcus terrestris]